MQSVRIVLGLTALSGCAGVYAEVAATRMTSGQLEVSGTSTDVGGTTVGFNVGAEFGSTRQRFTMGYAADSVSFDGGKASFSGAAMRYDFNLIQLAERLKLRAGFGFEAGKDSSTSGGMTDDRGNGGMYMGGLDATYFLRWQNPVHVFVGAAYQTHDLANGSYSGTGVTARVAISHTFGDPRSDASFVVPLESNQVLTDAIEDGARSLGCKTENLGRTEYTAAVAVTCGGRELEYFQIADGIMVTCKHAQTKDRCIDWSADIVHAAAARREAPPAPSTPPPATEAPPAATEATTAPAAEAPPAATDAATAPAPGTSP